MATFRKAAYRAVRYNSLVEKVQNSLRREKGVNFPEIDVFVPCGPGDKIIDAGANVGDITSRCARTGATVFAFEPNPVCAGILRSRFAYFSNVKILSVGALDRDCTLTLSTPKADSQYDALETTVAASFLDHSLSETDTTEVECIDLASFISSIGSVSLLKMDIEGSEVPVLNRLIDTGVIDLVDVAIVETHERLSSELAKQTQALRQKIKRNGLENKVHLDWI